MAGVAFVAGVSGIVLSTFTVDRELALAGYVLIAIAAILCITLMGLGRKQEEAPPTQPPAPSDRHDANASAGAGGVASASTQSGPGIQVNPTIIIQPPGQGPATDRREVERRIDERLRTPLPWEVTTTYDLHDRLHYTANDRTTIRTLLAAAANSTAEVLAVDPSLVRANVFGLCEDNQLRIIQDFMYNMNRREEWSIALCPGEGSTGKCFQQRSAGNEEPKVTTGPEINAIRESERKKAHPDLAWILSVAIYSPGRPETQKCVWVLNVDGLRTTPSTDRLHLAGRQLFNPYSVFLTYTMGDHAEKLTAT